MRKTLTEMLARFVAETQREKLERLEVLAAAFVQELGVPPTKVELVEDHTEPKRITYYFRVRQS